MRFRELKAFLTASNEGPLESGERIGWLEGRDISTFLEASTSEDVPIYVSHDSLYLYSAFVPEERLTGDWIHDGLAWNFSVPHGWGYGWQNTDGEQVPSIFPPLDHTGSRLLDCAESLIFWRCLEGRGTPYVELNQRFAHVTGIHRLEEDGAYRRLDGNGDFEDVVRIECDGSGWICTASRIALDFYMWLTDTVLISVFEAIRPSPTWSGERRRAESVIKHPHGSIFARRILASDEAGQVIGCLLRGFQVIHRRTEDETLWRIVKGAPLEPKKYATFLIDDWKNRRVIEWPCSPESLGNYFVKSDLPYGTSPAFFRPEVLSKYKQNPDKYALDVRSIHCRGTWSLRSYDINEEGQVHTYIRYLGDLPSSEQLYWKGFNEAAKGGISKRAYQTDFEASWDVDPDPVWEIRALLRDFPATGEGNAVWSTRSAELDKTLELVSYVMTDSPKEWRDAILDLSKVVIEGLEESSLRKVAGSLGCDDSKLRSLKLTRKILEAKGADQSMINEICDPLDDLQSQRSGKAAHGLSAKPPARPREDFRLRLMAVKGSLERLTDLVRKGFFDLGTSGKSGG